ncbi:universal stress protein [Pontibacter qinzhouensis]|uniref:Universal stress protein n=1 Tax=Pontibacter qinzhouensis TaxID=2603253 RepID=A0A5C8KDI9_9BACT|nr:universal stress protein [Pontibacter qinzhouensis]TXK51937.1 universal stress protein [Pontibacter qinzhouensis]
MYILKRIMVALDLTDMDETLIRYAAFLSNKSTIEKVFFIHTEKSLEIPAELLDGLERDVVPTESSIRNLIETKVATYFAELPNVQVEVQVAEGGPVKEMLRLAEREDINLLLVGRKLHLRGSGVLPQKLLRTGKISVLFVPENNDPKLNRALVALDFSEYCMMALDRMLHSALNRPNLVIDCIHVYEVPTGYITLGESYKAFDQRMQGFASQKFEQVLEKFPELKERAHLRLVKQEYNDDLGEIIVLEAKRSQADLLVLGAKGKSAAALFLLGSVTEKVLRHNDHIPLMVFRNDKEEVGFLDALLDT